MDGIADFFRSQDIPSSLDERTWHDLLFDDVFAHLDRTQSSVGQQILYYRLRLPSAPRALEAFDALVVRFSNDVPLREAPAEQRARLREGVLPGLDAQDPLVGVAVALDLAQREEPVAA